MRKIVLLALFLGTVLLCANPLVPRAIQQFWFAESGDFMLQFGDECMMMGGVHDFSISDGVSTITPALGLPDDYQLYPFTINLSTLMPGSTFSPESGFFQLSNGGFMEEVRWGPSGDVDLSSLIATQSIYQSIVIPPGHDSSQELWAKSDHPDLVTNYNSSTRSTISIYTQYPDGTPAANIPLYYQNLWPAWTYSNTEGKIELSVHSAKTNLRIRRSEAEDVIFEEQFIAEPAGCYVYNVVVQPSSTTDLHQETPRVTLKLSPNVLKPGQEMHLDLDKSEASPDKIRILDVKGRIVGEYQFAESWQPPRLSSGVYFLQLRQGDKALDQVRFIMLK